MNTDPPDEENGVSFGWVAEREQDLATWLDEIDPELHEQVLCGSNVDSLEAEL